MPDIDYQLFVELNSEIDFLVLVRTPNIERLSEEQENAIYRKAMELPTTHDKGRIGVVMVDKRGIWYRDGRSSVQVAQNA